MAALVQQSAACVSKFSSPAFHSWNSACSSRDVSLASGVGCPPGTFLLKFPCYSTKSVTYDKEDGKAFRSGLEGARPSICARQDLQSWIPEAMTVGAPPLICNFQKFVHLHYFILIENSAGRRRGHLMVSGGEPADKVMPSPFTQSPGGNVSRRQQKVCVDLSETPWSLTFC